MKTSSSATEKSQGQKDSNGSLSLNRKRLGFTLAELIVVITILAILSTIGFLALSGYRNDAKDAVIQANIRSIYTAINAEAASTSTSARCFIVHSSEYTLTGGAVVALDSGASDTLR